MSLKQLYLIVACATIICWLSWALVIWEIDPTSSGLTGLAIFFASLFFSLLGTFFMIVLTIRKMSDKEKLEHQIVGASFRQSFFFALVVIGALFLQSRHFLTWWNIIILVLAISALEFFFLSFKKSPTPPNPDDSAPQGFIPPDF